MSAPDDGRRLARQWFDRLKPIPQAFALGMIHRADRVMATQGTGVVMGLARETAVALVRSGPVRIAPVNQPFPASKCRIVVIGDDGFPLQLQTEPLS